MQGFDGQISIPANATEDGHRFLNDLAEVLRIRKGTGVFLDASNLESNSSASVQVLVFAARMCEEQGVACWVNNVSGVTKAALSDFGVSHLFTCVENRK